MSGSVVLINGIYNTLRISEPIGICSIAAVLRQNGYAAHIIEPRLMELNVEQTAEYAVGLNPTYIGISTFSFEQDKVFELARLIKQKNPNAFVVIGGLGPTLTPEIFLNGCDAIDAISSGEGEYTSVELVELLLKKDDSWKNCKGIVYLENGELKYGPISEKIHNLDDLPFMARDILELNIKKYGLKFVTAPIMGSRGCFGNCSYCWIAEAQKKQPGLRYRLRSIESIVNEIEFINKKYGVTDFSFEDDNFIPKGELGLQRVKTLAELIQKKSLNISFFMQTRPDTLSDDVLKYLRQAGLKKLFIGIEAISDDDLSIYNKQNQSAESVRNVLEMIKRNGFDPNVGNETKNRLRFGYIAFHQGTTLSSVKASVQFFKENKLTPKRLLTKVNYFEGDIAIKKNLQTKGLLKVMSDDEFIHPEVGLIYNAIKSYAAKVLPYRESIRDIEKHVFRKLGNKDCISDLCEARIFMDHSFFTCFDQLISIADEKDTDLSVMKSKMELVVDKQFEMITQYIEKNEIRQKVNDAMKEYGVIKGMHNIYW